MIESLFGSLFGGGVVVPMTFTDCTSTPLSLGHSPRQTPLPVVKVPAGIRWERAGPRRQRVTIQREDEWWPDYSALQNVRMAVQGMQNAVADSRHCPWCGGILP